VNPGNLHLSGMTDAERASSVEGTRMGWPDGAVRRTRYRYVDFAARAQPGFRNHVVTVDEVAGLVARWGAQECYTSIFRFSADILLYLAEHRVDGRPSVAGYDGPVWAPFLPLDIDAHPPVSTLTDALEVARRTHGLLVDRWHVPPAAMHIYFSGAKGFHILVDMRAAGRVVPARNLHRIFVRVRLAVLEQLPAAARPLFDLVIGDKVRLLRLPNTRHADSGLFKVALTAEELHGCCPDEIRALARTPRPLTRVTRAGLDPREKVAAAPALVERFERARRALRRERGAHPYRFSVPPAAAEAALCAARLAMWRADVSPGNRNNATIRLASAFRLAGYTSAQTRELLRGWAERQTQPLAAEEIERVVHSAYVRPYAYTYGCHDQVIRSFCPYASHLDDCTDYRTRHPRSERSI
jgi:hypothetical protein